MADEYITSDITGTYTVGYADDVYLLPGVTFYEIGTAFEINQTADIVIGGTVFGGTIFEQTATSKGYFGISVLESGIVHGEMKVLESSATNPIAGLYFSNDGSVTANWEIIDVYTDWFYFTNTGTMTARQSSVLTAVSLDANDDARVVNTGTMTANYSEVMRFDDYDNVYINNTGTIQSREAIRAYDIGTINIHNSGTITGYLSFYSTNQDVNVNNSGLMDGSGFAALGMYVEGDVHVINSGTIVGLYTTEVTDSLTVFNTGTITRVGLADTAFSLNESAIYVGGADAVLHNSGLISGDVTGGDVIGFGYAEGTLTMYNGGTVQGSVNGMNQGDFYRANGAGVVTGGVFGQEGDDTLIGGSDSDLLDGGDENDLLRGQAGNDEMIGGNGADTLDGGDGNDTLTGGSGLDRLVGGNGDDNMDGGADFDRLYGGNGADTLNGGTGNDSLWGGNDDDLLMGGDGDDRLFGGVGVNEFDGGLGRDIYYAQAGEDILIFRDAAESATGAARDVVYGYDVGQDQIDLAAVAPGVLTYLGTSAFSGTANEVRIIEYTSGSTVVQVDVNADGASDMELMVYRVQGLTEDDFVL
ncbi:calcium-binding protein [Tropicibacter naphthalenivorans]|uniref:Hemolysin IA n=1 Tax=Tropicibacter naphthalenivorans TaxID=441103 RepID=A0A0P1GLC4_9RHOB|nr:calcium-binding protein [Tropicibacter naphthalenivorans]CUH76671.1 Hemolysin IA [Tropicibacter naphthalenivorans]SMC64201.1 Hemolysin-type calcium-binding repeat-containing protein [Tropicibacter naphthalenivorans]